MISVQGVETRKSLRKVSGHVLYVVSVPKSFRPGSLSKDRGSINTQIMPLSLPLCGCKCVFTVWWGQCQGDREDDAGINDLINRLRRKQKCSVKGQTFELGPERVSIQVSARSRKIEINRALIWTLDLELLSFYKVIRTKG